jgi:hypothetical protein
MKKLMAAFAVCMMLAASSSMGAMIENPGFETQGDGGGDWSAAYWGDGQATNATYIGSGRTTGGWRSSDFSGDGRPWVYNLTTEDGGTGNPAEVWQQHGGSDVKPGWTYTFGGDFYVGADFEGSSKMEIGFINAGGDWTTTEIDLTDAWTTKGTWHTLSVDAVAPADTTWYQVTLNANRTAGTSALSVDNVTLTAVPEPVSAGLLGLGLGFIYLIRRKVKK